MVKENVKLIFKGKKIKIEWECINVGCKSYIMGLDNALLFQSSIKLSNIGY